MAGWTIFSKKNERKETDPAADANGEERREEEATPVTATETQAESTPTEETVPEAKPESAASGTETEDNTPETGNQEEDKSLENIVDRMADAIQQELYKTVAEKVKEALSPLQQNFHALGKALETLNRNQQELYKMQQGIRDKVQEGNTRIEEVVEAQEATIQKQHNSLLKFQEDVIYKIQKNLIMELIGIADNIRMIIENKENDPDYDLMQGIKDLEQWVDATLDNNGVKIFRDTELDNATFNRKRQELVDKEETTRQELDGTYKSAAPGYVWTLPYLVINSEVQLKKVLEENAAPQRFSYVIRPEEIVRLYYKEKPAETESPMETETKSKTEEVSETESNKEAQ